MDRTQAVEEIKKLMIKYAVLKAKMEPSGFDTYYTQGESTQENYIKMLLVYERADAFADAFDVTEGEIDGIKAWLESNEEFKKARDIIAEKNIRIAKALPKILKTIDKGEPGAVSPDLKKEVNRRAKKARALEKIMQKR